MPNSQYPLTSAIFDRLLPDARMTVIDAGARGGSEWNRFCDLGRHLRLLNFEPDPEAYQELAHRAEGRACDIRLFTNCLGRTETKRPLYLSKAANYNTSLLLVNLDRYRRKRCLCEGRAVRISEIFEIERTETVDTISLDDILTEQGVDDVDYIKVDIEGVELELLQASPRSLDAAIGVAIDVIFHEDWHGAPLFADVDQYMRSRGFVLFDLRSIKRSEQFDTPIRYADESGKVYGQLACADAIYFRDFLETGQTPPSLEKQLKLAIAAEVNRHVDFAFEVVQNLRNRTEDAALNSALTEVVEQAKKDYAFKMRRQVWRRNMPGLTKLIELLPRSLTWRMKEFVHRGQMLMSEKS
jgi:FkbM family methyltransferase